MKTNRLKKVLLAWVLVMSIATVQSCKKEDAPVTECFPDEMSATFTGSGTINGTPYTGTFEVEKTSCTEADLSAPAAGYSTHVKNLKASADGGFAGKTESGKNVSISLDGSTITIQVQDEVNFRGTK